MISLTPERSHQLALDLRLDEVEDDAADRNIDPAAALQFNNAARDAFEDLARAETVVWMNEYRALRDDGWPWRVAAYIAWAACPRKAGELERWPGTMEDLAKVVLGLRGARVVRKWRHKNPTIDETVGLLATHRLREAQADIVEALKVSAATPDYKNHNDRKLALEMLDLYTPRSEVRVKSKGEDLSQLSEAELQALAGAQTSQGAGEGHA